MLLLCRGNIELLKRVSVGFCGSREASEKGMATARDSSTLLANENINIVSGFAAGVDMNAHRAALAAGGTTTVVLAEGILRFRINKDIRDLWDDSCTLVVSSALASRVGKGNELLGEGSVFAQCRGRNPCPFAIAQKNLRGISDHDSARNGFRNWSRRDLDLAVPRIRCFPGRNKRLRLVPVRFGGLPSVELPTECARDVNRHPHFSSRVAPPFEFTGTRVLGMPAFTLLAVSAIQLESHAASAHFKAALHAIAR